MSTNKAVALFILAVVALFAVAFNLPSSAGATPTGLVIQVNKSLVDAPDANPGDEVCETAAGNNVCTLRAAIMEANAYPGADTIQLQPGATYVLTLPGDDQAAHTGDLDILEDLTIEGAGATVDGGGDAVKDRVIQVYNQNAAVQLFDLTITNGKPVQNGGGIYNYGTLTLTNVTVRDNWTGNYGGGILDAGGDLTLINSTVRDNECSCIGAGISIAHSTLTLLNSTISGNDSINGRGGGLDIYGQNNSSTVLIVNSTISGNHTIWEGGGVYSQGSTVTFVNSTVSGNSADRDGGGLFAYNGTVNLRNTTIARNYADWDFDGTGSGGGIYNASAGINLANTLLANNVENIFIGPDTPDDCDGSFNSEGYNLIETTTDCSLSGNATGNQTGIAAMLGLLEINGGPTETLELLPGSPAIDAGHVDGCADTLGSLLAADQRGFERHTDGGSGSPRCDIGAFEFGAALLPPTPTPTATASPTAEASFTPTATGTVIPTMTPTITTTPPAAGASSLHLPFITR